MRKLSGLLLGFVAFFLATILQKGQFLFKMSAQNSLIQLVNSQELIAGKQTSVRQYCQFM